MSQENIEHARQGYAALSDGLPASGLGPLRRLVEERFDPEVTIKPAGVFPESDEVHGRDGALRFLETQMEAFEAMSFEPLELLDAGDSVVASVRIGGRARHTGIELEFERIHVWTYRSGKVLRLEIYPRTREALEAVGLSE
jgi:ketosteroid isomerase-like protein